uniref:Uncharacterized protein n=1 Tax=Syphacia muris TaxID=451379 RepID=A0A0N5AXH7_9BILA
MLKRTANSRKEPRLETVERRRRQSFDFSRITTSKRDFGRCQMPKKPSRQSVHTDTTALTAALAAAHFSVTFKLGLQ